MKTEYFCIAIFYFLISSLNLISQNNRLWATYYGGTGHENQLYDEVGQNLTTDAAGNVYLAGFTSSASGIASGGFQNTFVGGFYDAYLVKFSSSGAHLWATYYAGPGDDYGSCVSADAAGNVYLAGSTESLSGIASGGFQNTYGGGTRDAFLAKFDAVTGNLLWATYYGGAADEDGNSVATDASGNVYLAGITESATGISSGGFQNVYGGGAGDGFLVKFNAATGTRIWATYYGGTGSELAESLATDAAGNIYLGGMSVTLTGTSIASGGFQNTYGGGLRDAFLVKFDPTGARLWGTYYGEQGTDYAKCVATDAAGNVYLAGQTTSIAGISSGGFQNIHGGGSLDAFLVKFSSSGTCLWATYYGETANDYANSVATDPAGNVYLAGDTYSPGSGLASGGFQTNNGGTENEFLVKFSSSGNRLCASYYGQAHDEEGKVNADRSGNVYLTGFTRSSSGIASGGFQNTYGGGNADAYLVKFGLNATATSTAISCFGQCTGTATVTASGSCTPPYTYSWNSSPVQVAQTATGLCPGTYSVTVADASGASAIAVVTITQALTALSGSLTSSNVNCNVRCNGNTMVVASGGAPAYTYLWNTIPVQATANATGLCVGNYSCTITDANGCTTTQTVAITEPPPLVITITSAPVSCSGNNGTANAVVHGGTPSYTYLWSPAGGTGPIATGLSSGIYTVTITDLNGCTHLGMVTIDPGAGEGGLYLPNAFSPNNDNENDVLQLYYTAPDCIKSVRLIISNRWGETIFETVDLNFKWDAMPAGRHGTHSEEILNTQVLVYSLHVEFMDQALFDRKGNLSLIR